MRRSFGFQRGCPPWWFISILLIVCGILIHTQAHAAPVSGKLRIFIQPISGSPPPQRPWMSTEEVFIRQQYRQIERMLTQMGIYEVVPENEVRGSLKGETVPGWKWKSGDWSLVKEIGRMVGADYAMVMERDFQGLLYWRTIFFNLTTGRRFEDQAHIRGGQDPSDYRELQRESYRRIFRQAKGDMMTTAIRKGKFSESRAVGDGQASSSGSQAVSEKVSAQVEPPSGPPPPAQKEQQQPADMPTPQETVAAIKPSQPPPGPSAAGQPSSPAPVEAKEPLPPPVASVEAGKPSALPPGPVAASEPSLSAPMEVNKPVPPPAASVEAAKPSALPSGPVAADRPSPPASAQVEAKKTSPPPTIPAGAGVKTRTSAGEPGKKAGERLKLIVYDFEAAQELRVAGLILAEALREELHQIGRFVLVNREDMVKVLEEQKLKQSGLLGEDGSMEIGKWLMAREIVTGKLARLGGASILQAKRTDMETLNTRSIGSLKCEAGKEEDLINGMPDLARRLADTP